MVVISDINSPERKKLNGENDSHERSRSLNDFHDAILKHILSSLPTKVAAKTSVLSKRWQYMWTSLPNLDFPDYADNKRDLFMNFVERALILHNGPWIRKFSLNCDVESDVSRIKTWISGAVSRKAKEFHISLLDDPFLIEDDIEDCLPFCLFSCKTMEVLELHILFSVQLPSLICLPRLKILTLQSITFMDYHPTNLLFASPALEQLVIDDCTWAGDKNKLRISASKLWKLTIDEGIEKWEGRLASDSVKISSPKLKVFRYTGGFIKDYRFPSSPFISEATLTFHYSMRTTAMLPRHFEEFLRSLELVKYLHMSVCLVEPLSHVRMPIFKNLIYLELLDGRVDPSSVELETVLNNCPRLETLKFPKGFSLDSETYKFDNLLDIEFMYLPSTLKKIMIGGFHGSIKEISVVQFFLSEMKSLKTMEIVFRTDVEERKEVETILSALPKSSKSCKLKISLQLS